MDKQIVKQSAKKMDKQSVKQSAKKMDKQIVKQSAKKMDKQIVKQSAKKMVINRLPLELMAMVLSCLPVAELKRAKKTIVSAKYLKLIDQLLFAIGVVEIVRWTDDIHGCLPLDCCKIYRGGVLHSETEPAFTYKCMSGDEEAVWYYKGLKHRPHGYPASIFTLYRQPIYTHITLEYWEHGVLHCIHGPAVSSNRDNKREYWHEGIRYNEPDSSLFTSEWWLTTPVHDDQFTGDQFRRRG